jgi:hypothetical protein
LAQCSPIKLPDISAGVDTVQELLQNPLAGFPLMEILLNTVHESSGEKILSSYSGFYFLFF